MEDFRQAQYAPPSVNFAQKGIDVPHSEIPDADTRNWIVVGLWGLMFATVFGEGLYAFIDGHWAWGSCYTACGILGVIAVDQVARGKRLSTLYPPQHRASATLIAAIALIITWMFLGYDIHLHSVDHSIAAPSLDNVNQISELKKKLRLCSNLPILLGWGGSGPDNCSATVNRTALMEYADKYNVAFACGIEDKTRDRFQDLAITITPAFVIHEGNIDITTRLSSKTTNEVITREQAFQKLSKENMAIAASIRVWYETLLVPKDADMSDFHRLTDVTRLGGIILDDIPTAHRSVANQYSR